jgi:hypothetical protein
VINNLEDCNIKDSIKAKSVPHFAGLHLREYVIHLLLVAQLGFSLKLKSCPEAEDEGQHQEECQYATCQNECSFRLYRLLAVLFFVFLLPFF